MPAGVLIDAPTRDEVKPDKGGKQRRKQCDASLAVNQQPTLVNDVGERSGAQREQKHQNDRGDLD